MVSFIPSRFTPEEMIPGTHFVGDWMDPRADKIFCLYR
jgi:hypothetical protein